MGWGTHGEPRSTNQALLVGLLAPKSTVLGLFAPWSTKVGWPIVAIVRQITPGSYKIAQLEAIPKISYTNISTSLQRSPMQPIPTLMCLENIKSRPSLEIGWCLKMMMDELQIGDANSLF